MKTLLYSNRLSVSVKLCCVELSCAMLGCVCCAVLRCIVLCCVVMRRVAVLGCVGLCCVVMFLNRSSQFYKYGTVLVPSVQTDKTRNFFPGTFVLIAWFHPMVFHVAHVLFFLTCLL